MPRKKYNHKGYSLYGWFAQNTKKWYSDRVSPIKNGIVVEIGVYGGASLLSIVDICKENKNHLYGIDPWELIKFHNDKKSSPLLLKKKQNELKSRRCNLEKIIEELKYDHVSLIKDFSVNAARTFEDESVDLVFIDGSHGYESVKADLENWFPKIKKNGILGGDDWGWPLVQKAVCEFTQKNNLKVGNIQNHWEIKF